MAGSKLALSGRLALVTGAGSGIGKAVASLFATEGCTVALLDKSDRVAEVAKELHKASTEVEHRSFIADVSSASQVESVMQEILQAAKRPPSIIVNAAGITSDKTLLKMSESQFDTVLAVNLKGTFLVSQTAARLMKEHAVADGAIVNLSSIVGKTGNIGQTNYAASKAGVLGLSKTLAIELGRYGIRCNAVLPGFIDTPMTAKVPDFAKEQLKFRIPMHRMGTPEEIAEVCLFLASKRSSYITGASIEVTGGLSL